MTLTIITPTCGRPTLADTAWSVVGQLEDGDERLIIGDGPQPSAAVIAEQWPGVRYIETKRTGHYGDKQRDAAIKAATGDHLVFIDDDDIMADGALALIRRAVAEQPDAMHIFRNRWDDHPALRDQVLWRAPVVRIGNVGGSMIVVPREGNRAKWAIHPNPADIGYIAQCAGQYEVVWHEEVIAIIRPYQQTNKP
jgi:glycosyltransferase involved in cell wall biosynthesis